MSRQEARAAAIASTEQACPRCGTPRTPDQEYCLQCGLRLPTVDGSLARLRRRWIQRFGWYPGDWIWTALLTLLIAVAGAAAAIVFTRGSSHPGTTFVASTPLTSPTTVPAPATTTPLPKPPEPTTTTRPRVTTTTRPKVTTTTTTTPVRTTTTKPVATTTTPVRTTTTAPRVTTTTPPANGLASWPHGQSGWTVVLGSYPVGAGQATANATARRAAQQGLPQVGVLDSSAHPSLHAGYFVVFSGVYGSQAAASAALAQAHAKGFGSAYPREITS